jgi:hypothetical protein
LAPVVTLKKSVLVVGSSKSSDAASARTTPVADSMISWRSLSKSCTEETQDEMAFNWSMGALASQVSVFIIDDLRGDLAGVLKKIVAAGY